MRTVEEDIHRVYNKDTGDLISSTCTDDMMGFKTVDNSELIQITFLLNKILEKLNDKR